MQHFLGQMIEMFRLELFLQLSLATLFGGAIGLERELGGKPAGLRTNILICIGSVLYTKLSFTMAAATTQIVAALVRPTTAPRACRIVPAPMNPTPVTICAAMRVGSAFPAAIVNESLV